MALTRNHYQRNSSWNAPYTFSGKEKVVETGYNYFGARYYDSGLSVWLSVDPLSDKFPNISPYNYCFNNPITYVDPNGMEGILYVVDLRKNKSNSLQPYLDFANKSFKILGIKAEMKMAPDGEKTSTQYLDDTDGLVAIGDPTKIVEFVNNNYLPGVALQFKDFKGGESNPERAHKSKNLIIIDLDNLNKVSKGFGVDALYGFTITVIHGMGHNCRMDHSDNPRGYYQKGIVENNPWNARLLCSGDFWGSWKNELSNINANSYLVKKINENFGRAGISDNYSNNKKKNKTKK